MRRPPPSAGGGRLPGGTGPGGLFNLQGGYRPDCRPHVGCSSLPCWIVMRSWLEPSMFIVYSSVFGSAGSFSAANTIFELFGAYAGHRPDINVEMLIYQGVRVFGLRVLCP